MLRWLHRVRPASSRSTRLLLASLAWTVVGAALVTAGLRFLLEDPPSWIGAGLAVALVAGAAKGHFVLARRAERNTRRILGTDDRRCAGGAFSWGSWILVVVMAGAGALARRSAMPRSWLGLLYAGVGTALLLASIVSWGHWRRQRGAP